MTEDDKIDLAIALVAAEARLSGSRASDGAVEAQLGGFTLTYRFTFGGGGRVTQVDVPLSIGALTLWIHVTRNATVHSDGDPEEVRRELVDPELRERISSEFPVAISVENRRLRVERPQWIESPGGIFRLAELTVELAGRIEESVARVEARRAAEGSPYRGR